MEKLFKISASGSSVRTEIVAGITTFVTMSYIIAVNPGILSLAGMDFDALVVTTCFSSAFATFLMAFLANYPIALAPGMGLNAFFTFSVVMGMKINGLPVTWQAALAAVFVEGVIFILLTLTKVRETLVNSIPKALKIGISAGIGAFIAFIGLKGAGIIVSNEATFVALTPDLVRNVPALLTIAGIILTAVLTAYRVTGALLIGIFAVTGLAIIVPGGGASVPETFMQIPPSIEPIFMKLDFSFISSLDFWIVVFTFFFVDFFDTIGTLVGVCSRSGLLDSEGRLEHARGALMADAVGTVAGALMGTSTVTSYVESASGVEQGGRTGLCAVVTGLLFIAAAFFTPIVRVIPGFATSPALVIVGIYMMMGLKDLASDDWTDIIPAFLAFLVMPLTYSIAVGIEFALVTFVALKFFTGRIREVNPVLAACTILFIIKELLA